jgi:hypothetical protein
MKTEKVLAQAKQEVRNLEDIFYDEPTAANATAVADKYRAIATTWVQIAAGLDRPFERLFKGYNPCRLVSGRVTESGKVLVEFPNGNRRWLYAKRLLKK